MPQGGLPTDIEAFDFQITLELRRGGKASMWLNEDEQRFDGSWRVLSQNGQQGQLELTDKPAPKPKKKSDDKNEKEAPEVEVVKRRFEIRLEESGESFTLREEGADPRFGWLHFKKSSADSR